MVQILRDIFSDAELKNILGFKGGTAINAELVQERMQMPLKEYLEKCAVHLEALSDRNIHVGLGELIDSKMRTFVHTQLRTETIAQLRLFEMYPLVTN